MKNIIENTMNDVLINFIGREWCVLNNTGLTTTNYKDECQQEYYLLKYFPAYIAEYSLIYSKLLTMYKKESINIISIGCGAGIDYNALNSIKDKPLVLVKYLGIDIIDWKYRPNFPFKQIDISELNEQYFDNIDVIVFPKILTELDNSQILTLAKTIVNSNLPNELYFVNSYITQDSHNGVIGIEQFKIICQTLLDKGYTIEEDNDCSKYHFFKEHAGIRKYIRNFIYPNEIKNFLNNLKSDCKQYDESKDECIQCKINIYPMMNSKYIAFNIIKFVKNDN